MPIPPSSIIIGCCSAGGNPFRHCSIRRFSRVFGRAAELIQPRKPPETPGNPRKPRSHKPGNPRKVHVLTAMTTPINAQDQNMCVSVRASSTADGGSRLIQASSTTKCNSSRRFAGERGRERESETSEKPRRARETERHGEDAPRARGQSCVCRWGWYRRSFL